MTYDEFRLHWQCDPVRFPEDVCRKIEARLLLEAEKAASEALGVPAARLTAWNEPPRRKPPSVPVDSIPAGSLKLKLDNAI